ncbi:MAG: epoxyqueuosine reductase QueH [Bacteroidales bacterium]|nr:epoxyqueuosine reductase QueH [Bacteroidales bacterium]
MENKYSRLLLHACCGPCVTTALERLVENHEVSVFFFNPNIYPNEEYVKRKKETQRYVQNTYGLKVPFIEGDSNPNLFFKSVHGYENEPEGGERCSLCFRLRLEETARYAKKNGFSGFCTTLTLSPHKNAKLINQLGEEIASSIRNVTYFPSDFKKKDGFRRSVELAKEQDLYRQTYCGCIFSL